jgi:hypothetical protein
LYGVAYRTALEARSAVLRRRVVEAMVKPSPPQAEDGPDDLRLRLDTELSRLPDKYRAAIVLCELEGMTRKEAAGRLGCAEGTVASRLARGRELLARRLRCCAEPATAVLLPDATAAVPAALSRATIEAATLVSAGTAVTGGAIPPAVAALVAGVTRTMMLTKWKLTTAVLAALVIAVLGLGGFLRPAAAVGEPAAATASNGKQAATNGKKAATEKKADEVEPITAIWITDPRVQKELRLTDKQVKQVTAIRLDVHGKYRAEREKVWKESKKGDHSRLWELSKKIQDTEREALTQEVPKILSEAALKRLRQIQRQARGTHNLIRQPAIRKKLALDDEQVKKIEGLLKEGLAQSRKEAAKAFTGTYVGPLKVKDLVARDQKAYAGAMKNVLGVLTKAQRQIWDDLVGEPFAFDAAAK